MRELADADRIRHFMRALGLSAESDGICYLAGGATAVLVGWRETTIDVDIKLEPESDALLRAIQRIKEDLRLNVELASPADFIPLPAGWESRSVFVVQEGALGFSHFDPYSQALSKLERGHAQDLDDVQALVDCGLVEPTRARTYFDGIESELFRFPAIDPRAFRLRVEAALGSRL